MALNFMQKSDIIWKDGDILTARHHGGVNGLHGVSLPKTEEEASRVDQLKQYKTYAEVQATGTRTPYKDYIAQW